MKKPEINDLPSTAEGSFRNFDGSVKWREYAIALDVWIFSELKQPQVSKCANCEKEYKRGIEDGKIIAEHGTTNWID